MKIFLDSSDIQEIKPLNKSNLIDGVTTNPSLLAKQSGNFKTILKAIASEVKGPISAEVTATKFDKMIIEANILRKFQKILLLKYLLQMMGFLLVTILLKRKLKLM